MVGSASRRARERALPLVILLGFVALAASGWPQTVGRASLDSGAGTPQQTLMQRVNRILAQMTLKEELQMVYGTDAGNYAGEIAGIPRLGIPPLHMQDGSAGVRMTGTAALPAPIAMAASWDPKTASLYGKVLARDGRAKGVNVILAPMVNIDRTAQAGRNFESLGEDPYLASQMVGPEVASIEQNHVIATTKHYALNNQENGRLRDSSNVDMRTFHEMYLPASAAAVQAGTGAVMCSYNRVNSAWACENKQLLDILKDEAGFSGFVMSDWGAAHSTVAAANAGLDMEMPGGDGFFGSALAKAIADGKVRPARLDDQVRRILRSMMAAGLFRHPPQISAVPVAEDRRDARAIAEQSAVLLRNQSSLLPLDVHKLHSIALIGAAMDEDLRGGSAWVHGTGTVSPLEAIRAAAGPGITVRYAWAQGVPFISPLPTVDSLALAPPHTTAGLHGVRASYYSNGELSGTPTLTRIEPAVYANWQFAAPKGIHSRAYSVRWRGTFTAPATGSYDFGIESRGGSRLFFDGNKVADSWKPGYSIQSFTFTRRLVAGHAYPFVAEAHGHVDGYQMCRLLWQPPPGTPTPDIQSAVEMARQADVAIVFAGEFQTEQYDRPTIALEGLQEQLIRAVAHANPRTIVILQNGGPVAAGAWANDVSSVLDMWYPGEENGDALADLLFGKVNPSGKLPVTFPLLPSQVVAGVHWSAEPYDGPARNINYPERLNVGYRWYLRNCIKPLFPFGYGLSYTTFRFEHLTVRKSNAASPVFVSADVQNTGNVAGAEVAQLYLSYPKEAGEPIEVLRGFSKVQLAPGQTRRITFEMQPRDLSIWSTPAQQWQQIPGIYKVAVGYSSAELALHGEFSVPR
jgi:beta-glucosidase